MYTKKPSQYRKKSAPKQQMVIYKAPKQKLDVKYTDTSFSNGAVSASATFQSCLTNLVRGDFGINNFQGNVIQPLYLQVDYYWNTNQTFSQCRLMVFQWFDSATPSLGGIVQSGVTGIGTISPTLITNKPYIKVLHDDKFIMAPTAGDGATSIGNGVHMGSCFIPQKKLKTIRWNSSSNVVQDGNIYVMVVSDDIIATFPAVTFYTRLAFTDA